MTNIQIATEEQRKANSRAIDRLNTWRRQYRTVTKAIRVAKMRTRWSYGQNHQMELIALRGLREHAHLLMVSREEIGDTLRATSYTYVNRDVLDQVRD